MKKVIKSVDQIDDKVIDELGNIYSKKIKKTKKNLKKLNQDTRKRIAMSISAAFSFVIALFWRDAIQQLIDKVLQSLGLTGSTYIAKIIAAIFVTILGVIAINQLSQWGAEEEN